MLDLKLKLHDVDNKKLGSLRNKKDAAPPVVPGKKEYLVKKVRRNGEIDMNLIYDDCSEKLPIEEGLTKFLETLIMGSSASNFSLHVS
nr:hypothetical protein [Tanacetum cinerariifolium]